SRHGHMRQLRNLNPRYEADQVIPAGTVLNGSVRMAGLYKRWCAQGPRAELARQLMGSSVNAALVRTGPVEAVRDADGAPSAPARSVPRQHRVARGDTLVGIARRYDCDVRRLAQ